MYLILDFISFEARTDNYLSVFLFRTFMFLCDRPDIPRLIQTYRKHFPLKSSDHRGRRVTEGIEETIIKYSIPVIKKESARFSSGLTRERDDMEQVAKTAVVLAFRNWIGLNKTDIGSLEAWITNSVRSFLMRESEESFPGSRSSFRDRKPNSEQSVVIGADGPTPDTEQECEESIRQFSSAENFIFCQQVFTIVESMPQTIDTQVFLLYHRDNHSYFDIHCLLGLNRFSVNRSLKKIAGILRNFIIEADA